MFHVKQFGLLVIGGGHAGCEAALAGARMGVATALVSMDLKKIGEMSCNPSIGGVGKGQLTKEIDALGGEMGRNADYTGIQFKRLNTRKGGAVQSSRCQSDKKRYAQRMQRITREQVGLTLLEGEIKRIVVEAGRVIGVELLASDGTLSQLSCSQVVVTSGTFMRGLMHCGDQQSQGGRFGEKPSLGLSEQLSNLGLRILRLKTGTPPRLEKESIDFSVMSRQPGDTPPRRFSFFDSRIELPQVDCFLTFTNPATHSSIRDNLSRSPLYSGQIKGVGPRYCPSIEDKVVKFPDKDRHQLFFEPESLDSSWIYPNGISTSLPPDVQDQFVRTLPGCDQAKIVRYGYAVEYDCIDPTQLKPSLESVMVEGLFLAGQVNGTSGYEEAAAQGLIAGINGALKSQQRSPLILSRAEAYIGVMIDDLISFGVTEPYRMFTSRAEFRLSLREDNADLRLTPKGKEIGLVTAHDYAIFSERLKSLETLRVFLKENWLKPSETTQLALAERGAAPLPYPQSLQQLLKRPELDLENVLSLVPHRPRDPDPNSCETLEVEVKYEGYIEMQRLEIERMRKMNTLDIPDSVQYAEVSGLSFEVKEKLKKERPKTLGAAARISGVTPAALTALLFHLRQRVDGNHTRTI